MALTFEQSQTEHCDIKLRSGIVSEFNNWTSADVADWRAQQSRKRCYQTQVLDKLLPFHSAFDICEYAELDYRSLWEEGDFGRYSLKALKSRHFSADKPTVLVTGGVHGYETSGVQGAVRVAEFLLGDSAKPYLKAFNFVILPCVSPWSYETINRWNPHALDPNRAFFAGKRGQDCAEESQLARGFIMANASNYLSHFDLHETTDTDNSVFRPALSARDGIQQPLWDIPDGFYLVGDSQRPSPGFQAAIIERVKTVTHIAPSDSHGKIIGAQAAQEGLIYYDVKRAGLCIGVTDAPHVTTTEMYPDSAQVTAQQCVSAQLAAVLGGLDFLLASYK